MADPWDVDQQANQKPQGGEDPNWFLQLMNNRPAERQKQLMQKRKKVMPTHYSLQDDNTVKQEYFHDTPPQDAHTQENIPDIMQAYGFDEKKHPVADFFNEMASVAIPGLLSGPQAGAMAFANSLQNEEENNDRQKALRLKLLSDPALSGAYSSAAHDAQQGHPFDIDSKLSELQQADWMAQRYGNSTLGFLTQMYGGDQQRAWDEYLKNKKGNGSGGGGKSDKGYSQTPLMDENGNVIGIQTDYNDPKKKSKKQYYNLDEDGNRMPGADVSYGDNNDDNQHQW